MCEPGIVLGVPLMDEDHARLEALFARAARAAEAELPALLAEAEAETIAHFGREEQAMQAAGFPVLHCHVAQHKMILAEFETGRRASVAGDLAGLRDFLARVLPEVVAAHVGSVDRVTAAFLKGEVAAADFGGLRLDDPTPPTPR